jgi:hypothetical protein
MSINRGWLLASASVLLLSLVTVVSANGAPAQTRFQWDLVRLGTSGATITVNPGGKASALAQDNSMITVTGSGTFDVQDTDDVTGGGDWTTFAPDGTTVTGKGHYRVTSLIRFEVAPGGLNSSFHDNTGTLTDIRAGLAYLRIVYEDEDGIGVGEDDGTKGILGTPASVFEGITASKGFVDYWNRVAPAGTPSTPNANRTNFHILSTD